MIQSGTLSRFLAELKDSKSKPKSQQTKCELSTAGSNIIPELYEHLLQASKSLTKKVNINEVVGNKVSIALLQVVKYSIFYL